MEPAAFRLPSCISCKLFSFLSAISGQSVTPKNLNLSTCRSEEFERWGMRSHEQVQHPIQTDMIECISRLFLDNGLGMICDADARCFQHPEIVRPISYGDDLLPLQSKLASGLLQRYRLA